MANNCEAGSERRGRGTAAVAVVKENKYDGERRGSERSKMFAHRNATHIFPWRGPRLATGFY